MSSTVKGKVLDSIVIGGRVFLIALAIGMALVPLSIGVMWHLGWWSFESAAIALLIIACYAAGGSNE